MAIQKFINSFFRAVRLRKGAAPSVSSDHAQVYCSEANDVRAVLPTGADVSLTSGAGSVTGAANVGAGAGLFRDLISGTLNFRSLSSNGSLDVGVDGDRVVLDVIRIDGGTF